MDPVLAEIGPVPLWYYGLAYAIGLLVVCVWVWLKRENKSFLEVAEELVQRTIATHRGPPSVSVALWRP